MVWTASAWYNLNFLFLIAIFYINLTRVVWRRAANSEAVQFHPNRAIPRPWLRQRTKGPRMVALQRRLANWREGGIVLTILFVDVIQ